ncbi:MAG: DUF2520 domain-containing protein [Myxococcota bacterium]|nr:DUF2520 domain-containing protein [Myxococcota bacterium]
MTGSIFIAGVGALGGSLAVALVKQGGQVDGVYDIDRHRALAVGQACGGASYWGALPREMVAAETVIVAVPDGAVSDLAEMAQQSQAVDRSQVWLHVAGALPATALKPLVGSVRAIGAFHPAWAFPPGQVTPIPPGVCYAVDGDAISLAVARGLADLLGGTTVSIPGAVRPLYHAVTVMASNYIVALLAEAKRAFETDASEAEDIEPLLLSLARGALDRARESSIDGALSGPIRRGDAETTKAHLAALKSDEQLQDLYRTLGLATVRLTRRIDNSDCIDLNAIETDLLNKP